MKTYRRWIALGCLGAWVVPLALFGASAGETEKRDLPMVMLDQAPGVFVWQAYGFVDSETACVWDSRHEVFLSWGGHFLDVGHEQNDDVWVFSLKHPAWRRMPQVNGPRANCCANQLTFDEARGNLLVFSDDGEQSHGWIPVCIQGYNRSLPQVYDYGCNEWRRLRPWPVPPGGFRQHKGFVYHPSLDVHVLYGGKRTEPETWVYDQHRNEWTELQVENLPGKQFGCLLSVHPDSNDVLLWGRQGEGSQLFALSLTNKTWRLVETKNSPPWLFQAMICFDPHAEAFVLIGVRSKGKVPSLEIWKLGRDLAHWEQVPLPASGEVPGQSRPISDLYFTAVYSPELNLYLLLGGSFGANNFHTWTWRLAPTRKLSSVRPNSFPSRTGPAAPLAPLVSVVSTGEVEILLPSKATGSAGFVVERARAGSRRFENRFKRIQTEMVFSDFERLNSSVIREGIYSDRVDLSNIPPEWRFEVPPNPICVEYGKSFAPPERWNPLAVYAYRIREQDALGNLSGPSAWELTLPDAPDTPTVEAPPPDDPKNGIVTLRWVSPKQKNLSGYQVYCQLTKLAGPEWAAEWKAPYHLDPRRWFRLNREVVKDCIFEDDTLPGANNLRRYYVSVLDRFGQEGPPSSGAWAYRPENYDEPVATKRTPEVLVPELSGGSVTVDGNLSEVAWSKAAELPLGYLDGRRQLPSQSTMARMFTCQGNLYVAVVCKEDRMDELTVHRELPRDSNYLWKDDTIELVMVLESGDKPKIHQLMVSPANVVRDEYGESGKLDVQAWDMDLNSAVVETKGEWRVEMCIPLSSFKGWEKAPGTWRANLLRNRPQTAHRDLEETAWASPLSCRPHLMTRLGRLTFQFLGKKE